MEENDNVVRRRDGSVIVGLTGSEWEEYSKRFSYLSEEELIHILETCGPRFDKLTFELSATSLNAKRKDENNYGKQASFASSLFMLLSVHVKPRNSSSLFSVYGEITSGNKHYIYKRESHDVETFSGSDGGGYLSLNGPSESCRPDEACFLLGSRELSIRLYNRQGQHLYPLVDDDHIVLDYSPDDFEHVKDKVVENNEVSLTLKYVSIPMALYGYLDIRISKREGYRNLSEFVNVCGKVVAKYKNTFGNYDSEEIVLFHKNPRFNQYEKVRLNMESNLLSLSRCWVAAPAYSLLRLHIDLFDSGKNPILKNNVELETDNSCGSSKEFISGDYIISVSSLWFDTSTQLPEQDGCDNQISRSLEQCTPVMESAVEVFSVLVCYEECAPLQIHGHLQFNTYFASVDFIEKGFDIFKREKEDPLTLLGRGDAIPLLDGGSRVLHNYLPVSMICDLKDTIDGLNIKGYKIISEGRCWERQLCSVFRGDHGFAALHFAIFRSAAQAHLNVFVYQRKGSQCAVFGSICARYKDFDYSSQYKKNCYSIVFFKKGKEDLMQIDADGSIPLGREALVQMDADCSIPLSRISIPLSRSSFVVPSYSSSIFDLDLTIGTQKFTREINVAIDTPTISIKGEECEVEFVLEWSEVM